MDNKDYVSLNALAKELGINKSKLSYYVKLGLIKPLTVVGRMQIFDKQKTVEIIKIIKRQRGKKKSLSEIKEDFAKKQ